MKWLQKDSYGVPALLAIGLHLMVVVISLVVVDFGQDKEQKAPKTPIVQASVVDIKDTVLGKRLEEVRKKEAAKQAAVEAAKKQAEQAKKREAERKALEDRKKQLAQKKKEQEQEARRVADERQRQQEKAKQAEAEKAKAEQEAARQKEAARQAEDSKRQAKEKEAEAKRKAAEEEAKRKAADAKKEAERKRQEELKKEEARKKAEAARLAEEEKRRQEEARRIADQKRREEEKQRLAEEATLQALAEEEAQLRAMEEAQAVQNMSSLIQSRIERVWIRPPNARNGMKTTLQISFLPTGEVNLVQVVKSSGDALFDQRAVDAAYKVEKIEELAEVDSYIFERQFRSITLVFNPQDLRN